jgi:peptide/nickel transport system permease protein
MKSFLARRVAVYALVIWAALTLNFLLPRMAPGDPLSYLTGGQVSDLTPAQRQLVARRYGLDKPLVQQYAAYLWGVAQGDLGFSVRFSQPVTAVLLDRLPWTILLVGTGTALSFAIAIPAGVMAAWRRRSPGDIGLMGTALILEAIPGSWLAMIMIAIFAVELRWLPSFGATSAEALAGAGAAFEVARRLVLPLTTIVLATVGSAFLLVRGAMLTTLTERYILFAQAKGLTTARVLFRHALRNALLPIYTHLALALGAVMSGAVVVETVFSYPGLGTLIYQATLARDYPLLQGAFLTVAASVIGANLVADLSYPLIDPRVRQLGASHQRR